MPGSPSNRIPLGGFPPIERYMAGSFRYCNLGNQQNSAGLNRIRVELCSADMQAYVLSSVKMPQITTAPYPLSGEI